MRLMIGYDGSEHADAAIDSLLRAGLPDECEARVMHVVDVWPGLTVAGETDKPPSESAMLVRARELAGEAMSAGRSIAEQGAKRAAGLFSGWKVDPILAAGSPATALVAEARSWGADLIVVGSHGRGALGRAILGSISQSVVTHANCSVRVARAQKPAATGPVKLVLGLDGSPNAAAALNAVSLRSWPGGTEVRIVVAIDVRLATVLPTFTPDFTWPIGVDPQAREVPKHAAQSAAQELRDGGLNAVPVVRDGDPKHLLLEEAETMNADCIFVGARGLGRIEGFLLGSVSSAVSARAKCSVEVVRFE